MKSSIALDTNVLVYLHDNSSPLKRNTAKDLLALGPVISAQVVSEYLNTTRRLLDLSKEDLLLQASGLLSDCIITAVSSDTLFLAANLVRKYKFQLFDAVIIAAAIETNCDVLYSEDMHNGLIVEKKLKIINPFL